MALSAISGNEHGSSVSIATVTAVEIGSKLTTDMSADLEAQVKATHNQSDVETAINTLNDFSATLGRGIQFSIEEDTGKTVVKVVDVETSEVLRQIPSVEALEIARSLHKMQGLLIHEKA